MLHIAASTVVRLPETSFRSPLRYPGGKQKAIPQICKMFPASAGEYREPMIGGGSVYLHARKTNFAKEYWINDGFFELATFWQVVQSRVDCERLQAELEQLRSSFKSPAQVKKYFLKTRKELLILIGLRSSFSSLIVSPSLVPRVPVDFQRKQVRAGSHPHL